MPSSRLPSGLCALVGFFCQHAVAQPAAGFYKGKTIEIIVGFPPGAYNDVYSRLLASYLGRYIPGNPSIVTRNMPGAGSFVAVNHIQGTAPRDGTTIGLASPTIPLDEVLGTDGVRFRTRELGWIGRMNSNINVLTTWRTSGVKTIEQAREREVTLSGTGVGSTSYIYPIVMNKVIGTKFKLILGYKGSNEGMLAMERGESEGHSTSWTTFFGNHPGWYADGSVNMLTQFALSRKPVLKNVPTAMEFAETEEQKSILRAMLLATEIGYAFFTSPNVPADRLATLREAFQRVVADPEFLNEAARANAEIDFKNGESLQQQVVNLGDTEPAMVAKIKSALTP